jgi:hypothetical protein
LRDASEVFHDVVAEAAEVGRTLAGLSLNDVAEVLETSVEAPFDGDHGWSYARPGRVTGFLKVGAEALDGTADAVGVFRRDGHLFARMTRRHSACAAEP